jgi:phosphatidylglycerol:prolipoprotein diacylglycerol transferase
MGVYPITMCLAVAGGFLWLGWLFPRWKPAAARSSAKPLSAQTYLDSGLISLPCGLLGARAGYVVPRLQYFAAHPTESFAIWEGGLSWVGAALGILAALAFFSRWRHHSFWRLADGQALPGALVSFGGWLGCILDGCAYGRIVEEGQLGLMGPDLLGHLSSRWPTQLAGALLSLAVCVILIVLAHRVIRPGLQACLGLALLSAGALALSTLRADPVGSLAGIRLDFISSGGMLLVALGMLAIRLLTKTPAGRS